MYKQYEYLLGISDFSNVSYSAELYHNTFRLTLSCHHSRQSSIPNSYQIISEMVQVLAI
jgi:hypothetical protein